MNASITAIGIATPPHVFEQMESAEMIAERLGLGKAQRRLLKSVYKATGIAKRNLVLDKPSFLKLFSKEEGFPSTSARMDLYKTYAADLGVKAIKDCLAQQAEISLKEISHLITVSCTGMYAPGVDIDIINNLNLSSNIKRTAINFMGCYGAFNALKVAEAICIANPQAKVLVVCIELCSLHFQYSDSLDNLTSNAIFSDGAAAVLVQVQEIRQKQFSFSAFHCDLMPQTSSAMAWTIGDRGFDIVLSSYVPQAIESGIKAFAKVLLNQGSSELYAIHPGGIKILQACELELGIDKDKNKYAYQTLKDYGNMSSATVLFVLRLMFDDLDESSNQKDIFSCAFGPGLTLESMLLKAHITNFS